MPKPRKRGPPRPAADARMRSAHERLKELVEESKRIQLEHAALLERMMLPEEKINIDCEGPRAPGEG